MDIEFVRQLMRALEESAFGELEFVDGDERIRLVKGGQVAARPAPAQAETRPTPERALDSRPVPASPDASRRVVRAGVAGTFYTRPSPGEEPFVSPGQTVQEGDTLGIIEAMKMLNPVESEFTGRIVEIKAADGESIGVGDEIVVIEEMKPADV